MPYQIYSGNLGVVTLGDPTTFQPSLPFVMQGERVSLDFEVIVGANAGKVYFWLEFSDSPSGNWYREVAEENQGGGDVQMPFVTRTLTWEGGADIPANDTHHFSAQFVRSHLLGRIQIGASADLMVGHVRVIHGFQALAPAFAPVPTLAPVSQPYLP